MTRPRKTNTTCSVLRVDPCFKSFDLCVLLGVSVSQDTKKGLLTWERPTRGRIEELIA